MPILTTPSPITLPTNSALFTGVVAISGGTALAVVSGNITSAWHHNGRYGGAALRLAEPVNFAPGTYYVGFIVGDPTPILSDIAQLERCAEYKWIVGNGTSCQLTGLTPLETANMNRPRIDISQIDGIGALATVNKVTTSDVAQLALDLNLPPYDYDGIFSLGFAPRNSPGFSGAPTVPTPAAGDRTARIANTAAVWDAIELATLEGAVIFNRIALSLQAAPPWIGASLLNGFTHNANGVVSYRKWDNGQVEMRGRIGRVGAPSNGLAVLQLPSGYRPTQVMRFYGREGDCLGVDVYPSGAVLILMVGGNWAEYSFDGVRFSTN